MTAWKTALFSAAALALLWALSPSRSRLTEEPGTVEIRYMGPGGAISGAMDDAVRAFEDESRRAHAADATRPLYRVVSGHELERC